MELYSGAVTPILIKPEQFCVRPVLEQQIKDKTKTKTKTETKTETKTKTKTKTETPRGMQRPHMWSDSGAHIFSVAEQLEALYQP